MVMTYDRAVSLGGVWAARAEALAQTELQLADAVLQLPGCRSAQVLSLMPGERSCRSRATEWKSYRRKRAGIGEDGIVSEMQQLE